MAKRTGGTTGFGETTTTRAPGTTGTTTARGGRATGRGQQRGQATGKRRREEGVLSTARELGEETVERARGAAAGAAEMAAGVIEQGEESTRRVVGWVRENPWPTLLIGAGAAWLAIDAVRGREADERFEFDEEGPGVVRRSVSSVTDFGRRSASSVAGASRNAGGQVTGFVRENPMWAGLAALGIGLAMGLTLPSTMPENRMLGNARDTIVRKARQVADSATETVREVAKSAGRIAGAGQDNNQRSQGGQRG